MTDARSEGPIIAELALRDPHRPSLFAVRGSRLLGGGGYNNTDYAPRFADATAAAAELDRYAIPLVVLRKPGLPDDWAHIDQIEEARRLEPARWQLLYSDQTSSPKTQLYRLVGNDKRVADISALIALSAPHSLPK